MSRRLTALAALLMVPLGAQVFPETWREHKRLKVESLPVSEEDRLLFNEFGGKATEKAVYQGPAGKFSAAAWRLADATSALAWYQSFRPENGVPVRGSAQLAVTTPGTLTLAHQNYVLQFEGWRPTPKELEALYGLLPQIRSGGGLPVVSSYLPEPNRIRNSERFILGPTSLARFEPRIPPILAGFEQGAEAQLAKYRTNGQDLPLIIFNYPTPQIARQRIAEFEKMNGWVVRRSSSYLAVVPEPSDNGAATKLVESINYGVNFMWNEATKAPPMPDVGGMLVAIFELTGLLLVVCLGGGLVLAVLWVYLRKRDERLGGSGASATLFHIDDRS